MNTVRISPGRRLSPNGQGIFLSFTCFKAFLLLSMTSIAGQSNVPTHNGIEYTRVGSRSLKLDLYLPAPSLLPCPLIVWVHGGGWRSGARTEMPLSALVEMGYGVASVDYRLTPEAAFPANVHDLKAAVRFLRAQAQRFGLQTTSVAIAGSSAGGHLAALVGVTNGHPSLEGNGGEDSSQSSAVQAIVSFYGASNLQSILGQSTAFGLTVRVPALQLLLGGQPVDRPSLAKLASPVAHIDAHDPPLMLIHGDQDPQMPIDQSRELTRAYEQHGLTVRFVPMPGSKHGGKEFYEAPRMQAVKEFLVEAGIAPRAIGTLSRPEP